MKKKASEDSQIFSIFYCKFYVENYGSNVLCFIFYNFFYANYAKNYPYLRCWIHLIKLPQQICHALSGHHVHKRRLSDLCMKTREYLSASEVSFQLCFRKSGYQRRSGS